MAVIPGTPSALRACQLRFRQEAGRAFATMADTFGAAIRAQAGPDGTIPRHRRPLLTATVRRTLDDFYVGPTRRPILGRDQFDPNSPFAELLLIEMATVTLAIVDSHDRWLERNVPSDVYLWLSQGHERRTVSEQFGPNHPLVDQYRDTLLDTDLLLYDDRHFFVPPNRRGPDGYRLSDRIWRVNRRSRARIDRLLTRAINEGVSAERLARSLESSLRPDRKLIRTRTPYNRDASYDAMRLARTEITAAAGRAGIASARANPYVRQMRWNLSPQHPRTDICDNLVGDYNLDDVPNYPAHAQCLCHLSPVTTRHPSQVAEELRSALDEGRPFTTPASPQRFAQGLIGSDGVRIARQPPPRSTVIRTGRRR